MEKSKYKSLTEFKKDNPAAYSAAKRKGLIQKLCDTFGWKNTSQLKRERKQYTEEDILFLAKDCRSLKAFQTNYKGAYSEAKALNILDKVKQNIGLNPKKKTLTKDEVLRLAEKYYTFFSFQDGEKEAAKIVEQKGWSEDVRYVIKKKEWERLKGWRALNAYMQTKEFKDGMEVFEKTFVDEEFIYYG